MRSNHPGKMKSCNRFGIPAAAGSAGWNGARAEFFPSGYFYVGMIIHTFAALPDESQSGSFDHAAQRGQGLICMWSDGERQLSSDERVTAYRIVKWDGIKGDDEAAAEREVRGEAKAASSAEPTAPAGVPEAQPVNEPTRY